MAGPALRLERLLLLRVSELDAQQAPGSGAGVPLRRGGGLESRRCLFHRRRLRVCAAGLDFLHCPTSSAKPSDEKWGDYNTVREFEPTQKVWVAGSHYIKETSDCSNCSDPLYFVFGRARDWSSWHRWKKK